MRLLSYQLYYRQGLAQRDNRSLSFPPDLAEAIGAAAGASGTWISAWIAEAASHTLRLDAEQRGLAEWEAAGPLPQPGPEVAHVVVLRPGDRNSAVSQSSWACTGPQTSLPAPFSPGGGSYPWAPVPRFVRRADEPVTSGAASLLGATPDRVVNEKRHRNPFGLSWTPDRAGAGPCLGGHSA